MEGHTRSSEDFRDKALGLVSTRSFPAIVGTADAMLKTSGVTLVGYEKKLVVVIVQLLCGVESLMSGWR